MLRPIGRRKDRRLTRLADPITMGRA